MDGLSTLGAVALIILLDYLGLPEKVTAPNRAASFKNLLIFFKRRDRTRGCPLMPSKAVKTQQRRPVRGVGMRAILDRAKKEPSGVASQGSRL